MDRRNMLPVAVLVSELFVADRTAVLFDTGMSGHVTFQSGNGHKSLLTDLTVVTIFALV